MQIFLYVVIISVLAGIEGRSLVSDKKWRELTAFSLILLLGLAIIIMDSLTHKPFRFMSIIELIFRPYSDAVKAFLHRF